MSKLIILEYGSYSDFVAVASKPDHPVPEQRRDSITGSPSFTGTGSLQEAIDLAVKGWPSGVKKARAIAEPIERRLYSLIEQPLITYDVTGQLLDVGRYVSGEPEHWGNWDSNLVDGEGSKHIKMVVNGAASSGVDTSVLIARGATLAALVNLLEMAHHRVQVELCYGIDGYDQTRLEVLITVKRFDDVLDIDRLTMALAHPSSLRRFMFAVMEYLPDATDRTNLGVSGSYGQPCDVSTAHRGDLYFDRMLYGEDTWTNPEKATAWVTTKLEEMGVIKKETV